MKILWLFRFCIILLPLLSAISCADNQPAEASKQVKGVTAELREVSDETGGFGTSPLHRTE